MVIRALTTTVVIFVSAAAALHPQADRIQTAVAGLAFREIGPAVVGGRIADIAVVESQPQIFYVGTASGGVWKTESHGTAWTPLFDDQPTASIGDVTVAPSNPNVVWVGTGEPQNRQSSPWGNGVYRSTDAGRTWRHMGLDDTKHIARIVIHPTNPNVVFVAAVGHLWGPNPERGVYRTTDGGGTWNKVLYIDEHTGAIDLAMDPGDPRTLFAAMYQRQRTGFGFNGGGPGSGVYRTLDGGETWRELTNGLPPGDKGRIGLDLYRRDGNLVYAIIEADPRDPTRRFQFGQGEERERDNGVYRSTDRGETWDKMSNTNPRPMYYSQIRIDPNDPERIYVLGTQLMVSDDGGKTFRNDGASSIHVDHHALWIDPHDSDHLIIGSDGGVSATWDGTQTWRMFDNLPIGQFYRIGVDMRDPYYVCGGLQDNSSWCAPHRTLNTYGVRNSDWYDVWGGDGFHNLIDPEDHTIMFTESQGGNLGRVDVTTGERTRIRPIPRTTDDEDENAYRFNWDAPIVMSSHNSATIYLGANVLLKSIDRGQTWEEVSPDLTKQIDRKELEIMGVPGSEPMMSANDGISTYGNITAIAESPVNRDLLYVGTDDGNVQITRDGGQTWRDLTANLPVPERTYVSRIVASRFAEGTVFATFDGHRNDDYRPYVHVSDDYGETWQPIVQGLPDGWSVNVVAEHPDDARLLFVGNEVGVYFTIDRGANWHRLKNNLPTVPVDDIVIHPRDNDLVVGTHGRSIWILSDITPLQQLSDQALASEAHVFPVRPVTMYSLAGGWPFTGATYAAPNPPIGAPIRYFVADSVTAPAAVVASGNGDDGTRATGQDDGEERKANLTILDAAGDTVRTLTGPAEPGTHEVVWDLRYASVRDDREGGGGFGGPPRAPRVLPGAYTVHVDVNGQSLGTEVEVRADPRIEVSDADRAARHDVLMSFHALARPLDEATQSVQQLNRQISSVSDLLEEHDDVPAALTEEVDSLSEQIRELRSDIADLNRDARVANSIDESSSLPTSDQLWQLEQLWERTPALIERLNAMITERMPALNQMLNEHGIRPKVGEAISVPRRPDNR